MKIEMMTLSKLVMMMMIIIMAMLSDTVSGYRGEIERKARQTDEDVAKEGDFALIIL